MIAVSTSPFWLAVVPAREASMLDGGTRQELARIAGCGPRAGGPSVKVHAAGMTVGPLGTPALAAMLELVARDADLAMCVWLGEPANPGLDARRVAAGARRCPTRVVVDAPSGPAQIRAALRPSIAVIRGLIDLHMTVLLVRTPRQWQILAALRQATNSRRVAAAALGCSRQAVDQAVRRGAFDTSARTVAALAAAVTLSSEAIAD